MKIIDSKSIKLCHCNVGDVIQIIDENGQVQPGYYLITALYGKGKRPARPNMTHGLYDDQRYLFAVNLKTGEARELPHLSSKILPVNDIAILTGYINI